MSSIMDISLVLFRGTKITLIVLVLSIVISTYNRVCRGIVEGVVKFST